MNAAGAGAGEPAEADKEVRPAPDTVERTLAGLDRFGHPSPAPTPEERTHMSALILTRALDFEGSRRRASPGRRKPTLVSIGFKGSARA